VVLGGLAAVCGGTSAVPPFAGSIPNRSTHGLFLQSVAAVHSFRSLSVHDFVSTRSAQLIWNFPRLEPSGNAAAAGRRAALASGLAYQIAAPVLPRVAHVGGGGTRVRGAGQGSHQ
jgi:hypothetical protein